MNKSFASIHDIFLQHNDYVCDKWSWYFDIYDSHFSRFIDKSPFVLEIGIQNGGSLQILSKFLRNATLFGVDINPDIKKLSFPGQNIQLFALMQLIKMR